MNIKFNPRHFLKLFWPAYQENCAFLIGERTDKGWIITNVILTPNLTTRDATRAYAIGACEWREVKRTYNVIGHAHTHVTGEASPSQLDMRYIREGELGAVLHLRTASINWYTRSEKLHSNPIPLPWWMRVLAFVFCD